LVAVAGLVVVAWEMLPALLGAGEGGAAAGGSAVANVAATQGDKIEPVVEGAVPVVESVIPRLVGTNGGQLFGQAINYLRSIPGSARIEEFPTIAERITQLTRGQWSAKMVGANNATIFAGEGGEALVFDALGNMFRGQLGDRAAFQFVGDKLTVAFEALKRL
jgi:hypothetical protein